MKAKNKKRGDLEMENTKSDFGCPVCEDTGMVRFAGIVGKNPCLRAPCGMCAKGAKEKVRIETEQYGRKKWEMIVE